MLAILGHQASLSGALRARVDTLDMISQCRFATRYAYHHGYYDGVEREFRGFAMVETWDSEIIDQLVDEQAAQLIWTSRLPFLKSERRLGFTQALTKTPAQSAAFCGPNISNQTILPCFRIAPCKTSASLVEKRRARHFGLSKARLFAAKHTVKTVQIFLCSVSCEGTELHSFHPSTSTIKYLCGIFIHSSSEDLTYHLERKPDDGRMQHTIVLEADRFGNILKSIQIAYGRRPGKSTLQQAGDIQKQEQTISHTRNGRHSYDHNRRRIQTPCYMRDSVLGNHGPDAYVTNATMVSLIFHSTVTSRF